MTKQQLEKELAAAKKQIRILQEELEQTSHGVEAIEEERLGELKEKNRRLQAEIKVSRKAQAKLNKTVAELQPRRRAALNLLEDLEEESRQRRKNEQALMESEANLRSLINARQESIWSVDRQFCYIIFNEKFAANYRAAYNISLKKGLNALDILTPELRAFWQSKYEQALGGKRQVFELTETLPGGRHYYEVVLNPIRAGKEIIGVSAISGDITERKHLEHTLQESEERFRLAFYTNPDAITISRMKDRMYIDVNRGFTENTGYTREEALGKTAAELNIWAEAADRNFLIKELNKKGRAANFETDFLRKDGTRITGLMSAAIMQLNGEPHIISVTRNIEHLKQLEREREKLLTESETARKLLNDVFSRINDGVVALDKNWHYTYLNTQAAQMLNRKKPEDLLGKHIWSEYPEGVGQPFYKAYYKAMETQETIYLQEFFEPWERWFENRIYP